MEWYQLAVNQNNSKAYNNIGCLYFDGLGVSQDYLTAIEYYLKAARDNHHTAMSNIGSLFLYGCGVSVDKYKALDWFIKSGKKLDEVKELNQQGIHLREEDKSKLFYGFEPCYCLIIIK
jgi:TPR repeat protein